MAFDHQSISEQFMATTSGLVFVDWQRVEVDLNKCFAAAELIARTGQSSNTINRVLKGDRVQKKSAFILLQAAGIENPHDYVSKTAEHLPGPACDPRRKFNQWELIEDPFESRSANGLVMYRVGKAKHENDGRISRAKCYDLESLTDDDIQYVKETVLSRHPEICLRLDGHPNFPKYFDCGFSNKKLFWVVDKWEAGTKLTEAVTNGGLAPADIPRIAREIATGLASLHENGVIRRELTPEFVMLRDDGRSVMLLDFELAKIVGGITSRPMEWSRSPFLAPELDSPNVDFRSDMFSWAQIVVYMLTERKPASPVDVKLLRSLTIPKKIFSMLDSCLQPQRNFRPEDFHFILKTIENWK